MENKKNGRGSSNGLTIRQRLVLEWLANVCAEEGKTITNKKIAEALLISEKAARSQVDALVKKKLILSAVACNKGSGKPIGRFLRITKDAIMALIQSDEKVGVKDDWETELSTYRLSKTEFQEILNTAIYDIKQETGKIDQEPSELMVTVYLKNNLCLYVEGLRDEKNKRAIKENYCQTVLPLERLASENPTDPDTWYKLADAYEQFDRLDKAAEAFEKIIEMCFYYSDAQSRLNEVNRKMALSTK